MANQPKKYKKFVATAATATLVASAIVPVASAAHTDTAGNQFESYINQATELGLFKDGGEFKPNAKLTRKQVVTIAGRFLETAGKKPAADYETKPAFTDLGSGDAEYLRLASVVKEAGIFSGDNGKINGGDNITRQHMAKVLNGIVESVTGTSLVEAAKDIDDAKVTDLAAAGASYRDAIQALADFGITTVEKFNPKGEVTRGQFAKFIVETIGAAKKIQEGTKPTPDAAITTVTAVNKTTVTVVLNTKVDAVKAENFAIEGAKVNAATLSEDGKTVTLSVSGLDYDKKYTLTSTGIKVNDKEVALKATEFKTPAVTALWKLEVSPKENQVIADGADNTVIEFKLIGEDGKVDVNADNIVLEIGTTFGNLANTRVTIQDGVGQVVLSSEYSITSVTAQLSAKIIEASEDYKALIGKVVGQGAVYFVPSGATLDPNAVTFLDAESNQADRVVLYFDKAVDVATFVKVDETTAEYKTTTRTDNVKKQQTKDNVTIKVEQNGDQKEILGFKAVAGNAKAVEVILAKTKDGSGTQPSNTLTDNQSVKITANIGNTNNTKTFTLTDARQPEVTSVTPEGLKTLNLKFSESVVGSNIIIDGQLVEGDDFKVTYGEFDAAKAIDYRDTAKVELEKYKAGRPGAVGTAGGLEQGNNIGKQRYFAAGSHSVTVHQLKDFAGLTDTANVSSSQLLSFNIVADATAPTAKVTVESPEQFRITFDKEIEETAANIQTALNGSSGFQIYDTTNAKYVDISSIGGSSDVFKAKPQFVVTQPDAKKSEFVVELTKDWTELLTGTKDTYANYKFQFAFADKFFTNGSNGVKSGKVELPLNYTGSALNTVDNASPVISDIVATKNANVYKVEMNEPVKLPGKETASVGDTLSPAQGAALPAVQVEFQGKDKDGKIVVVPGKVGNADLSAYYANTNGDDKAFYVTTNYVDPATTTAKNLEDLVKEGYSADWKVVVKSISDDVGNTAATVTKDFKVEVKQTSSLFYILSNENTIGGSTVTNKVFAYDYATGKDKVEVTFSKAIVHTGGTNDLTNPANWTLNGKALENVESITVADGNGDSKDGNEKVIITFKDANALKSVSNVITVNKNVLSKDGSKLTGEYEVVADTLAFASTQDKVNDVALTSPATIVAAQNAINALPAGDPTRNSLQTQLNAKVGAAPTTAAADATAAASAMGYTPASNGKLSPATITQTGTTLNVSGLTAVSGFSEFSSVVAQQEGKFAVIKFEAPASVGTKVAGNPLKVAVTGGTTNAGTYDGTGFFYLVLRFDNVANQTKEVTVDWNGNGSVVTTYSITAQ